MQKILTGYTMYFNKRNRRTGPLFAGVFKSKHIADDRYLKRAFSYIHLNPVELYEPRWKAGVGDIKKIENYLAGYDYSSLLAFQTEKSANKKLLGDSIFDLFQSFPSTTDMLKDAQAYYQENFIKVSP